MARSTWLHVLIAAVGALAVLLFVRLHNASGAPLPSDSASAGHRLAEAWCKDCHAIEPLTVGARGTRRILPPSPTGPRPRRWR